jgi:uncharacterized protein (TIGR03435 family)
MHRRRPLLPVAVAALSLAPLSAQTPTPAFDVVSVKRAVPGTTGGGVRFLPGGRFVGENVYIEFVIQQVYGVRDFQIIAAPQWRTVIGDGVNSRYQIEGRGRESASEAELKEMVKTLLADRFQLRVHKEMRDLPVYALVPESGGVKGARVRDDRGGGIMLMLPGWTRGRNVATDALARYLSSVVDRPVIDRANLEQVLDFDLTWTPSSAVTADSIPGCPSNVQEMAKRVKPELKNPSCPSSVFTAVREQLGLRLESTQAPTEVIVVDWIQAPTEN